MSWRDQLSDEVLTWLQEPETPAMRHLVLRDLLDIPADDPDLIDARDEAHRTGPIAAILDAMREPGFWIEPGPGYAPKYRSTVWSIILLSQLGALMEHDGRISRACTYLLDHTLTEGGQFSTSGAPSGTVDCLQGNLCAALLDLGNDDPRLVSAFEWMTRTVTGEGLAPASERRAARRYYAGKCGPGFCCGANNKLPCAWGAIKVMLAFGKWPVERHTPLIERAIRQGIDFLLSVDPATAAYPCGYAEKPSGNWWKFGFPVFYVTDLLQLVEALASVGLGRDPRLAAARDRILVKQDETGRWPLEYDYKGKTWIDVGAKKQPNKWVTLRALRTLKRLDG